MTARTLLASLEARGVVVEAHGDRLRLAPAERVTAAEVAAMRRLKGELLVLLVDREGTDVRGHTEVDRVAVSANPFGSTVMHAVACAPEPYAWRLYSHRLTRELWVVRDATALAALEADGVVDGLPVVLAEELEALRGLDTVTLAAVLDAKTAFGFSTKVAPS